MSAAAEKVFAIDCLEAHNMYREMHGCPPLQLNSKLSEKAKEWAEHLLKLNKMEHSTGHNFGENIYMAEGLRVTGDMPVKAWYDEISDYSFEEPVFKPATGHFTQVIWCNSKELGVGIAQHGRITFVVTNYSPPGNYRGRFREQVPPKIKDIVPAPSKKIDETPTTSPGGMRPSNAPRLSIPRENIEISTADAIFHFECLEAHNKYRAMHGVPPLILTDELTQYATNWAQKIAETKKLRHSTVRQYGENIYRSEGVHISGVSAVKIWYATSENYNFNDPKFTPESGGFTQLVWKDTKELGVGVIREDRVSIVVASYYPPGNVRGLFKENVFPKISEIVEKKVERPLIVPKIEEKIVAPMVEEMIVPPKVEEKIVAPPQKVAEIPKDEVIVIMPPVIKKEEVKPAVGIDKFTQATIKNVCVDRGNQTHFATKKAESSQTDAQKKSNLFSCCS